MTHENSVNAWHTPSVQRKVKTLRQRVLDALYKRPMTGSELNRYLGSSSAHKRLSELRKAGLIVERRNRQCRVTGQTVAEWSPVAGQLCLFGGFDES